MVVVVVVVVVSWSTTTLRLRQRRAKDADRQTRKQAHRLRVLQRTGDGRWWLVVRVWSRGVGPHALIRFGLISVWGMRDSAAAQRETQRKRPPQSEWPRSRRVSGYTGSDDEARDGEMERWREGKMEKWRNKTIRRRRRNGEIKETLYD
jgi:hypothetical protein